MGLSELTGHLERLAWAKSNLCDVTRDASLYAYEHAILSLASLLRSTQFCNL